MASDDMKLVKALGWAESLYGRGNEAPDLTNTELQYVELLAAIARKSQQTQSDLDAAIARAVAEERDACIRDIENYPLNPQIEREYGIPLVGAVIGIKCGIENAIRARQPAAQTCRWEQHPATADEAEYWMSACGKEQYRLPATHNGLCTCGKRIEVAR